MTEVWLITWSNRHGDDGVEAYADEALAFEGMADAILEVFDGSQDELRELEHLIEAKAWATAQEMLSDNGHWVSCPIRTPVQERALPQEVTDA